MSVSRWNRLFPTGFEALEALPKHLAREDDPLYNGRLCASVRRTEAFMPLALTSQEKKVLGFLLLMVGLGLVMLGVKRATAPKIAAGAPANLAKTP